MSKYILILKNSASEGPGLLETLLKERLIKYTVIDLCREYKLPSVGDLAAVVILGGPDSANDDNKKMQDELQFIREVLAAKIPYLGICLGLQTLVRAAGGSVIKSPVKEVGFRDPESNLFSVELTEEGAKDPLFKDLGQTSNVFHLHGETVELVDGMTLLATGKFCRNQVVKVGTNAYGIQCHFELTNDMFEDWITGDPDLLRLNNQALKEDYKLLEEEYIETGRTLLKNFLDVAGFKTQ